MQCHWAGALRMQGLIHHYRQCSLKTWFSSQRVQALKNEQAVGQTHTKKYPRQKGGGLPGKGLAAKGNKTETSVPPLTAQQQWNSS